MVMVILQEGGQPSPQGLSKLFATPSAQPAFTGAPEEALQGLLPFFLPTKPKGSGTVEQPPVQHDTHLTGSVKPCLRASVKREEEEIHYSWQKVR